MGTRKTTHRISNQNNFIYLTLALVTLLISASLTQVLTGGKMEVLLLGVTIFTFLVCIISLRFDKNWSVFFHTLAVVWLASIGATYLFDLQYSNLIMLLLSFTFFVGTFKSIAKQILFSGQINNNKVVGSIALFLLLGLIWAVAYLILIEFDSHSFSGMNAIPWEENFATAAYFSFVTLTTLGYGDISPITPIAQTLVYLEAIAGVFYMAIVVSSLVSASISHKPNND